MADSPDSTATTTSKKQHPPGFRARRGLNWFLLGLMYASYYMCRYNFDWAAPELKKQYGFDTRDITRILGFWFWAYGVGQLVNGLLTDRIGGKRAMLIGAVGTILTNLVFGAASFFGTFSVFAMIWLLNGYVQAFGAPGMIKINAAWFHRTERGTFAGIFGFMIQLGRFGINWLAPLLLGGFVFIWVVPALHWRWVFWVPPMIMGVIALFLIFFVAETPAKAGFRDFHTGEAIDPNAEVRVTLKESFLTIARHPLVWFYAAAYACTGAVRHGADRLAILYFIDELGLTRDMPAVKWTLQLMPLFAVVGSLGAGLISDKIFRGHRSPVAMSLYFLETAAILLAVLLIEGLSVRGVFISCLFLVVISLTANSTHAIVGAAAPMDIGGPRMAGFAAGVIDSFQYFGAGIAIPIMGELLHRYGWASWFPAMAGFGFVGGVAMLLVMRKQRLLKAAASP